MKRLCRGTLGAVVSLLALAVAGAGVFASGCSSGGGAGPAPCNVDPFQCAAGQTCWVNQCVCPSGQPTCDLTNCTPQFACVTSEPNKPNFDSCHNTVGKATCGDRAACIEVNVSQSGECLPYCDSTNSARDCPQGQTCTAFFVGQGTAPPTVHACLPNAPDGGLPPFNDAEADAGLSDRDIPDVVFDNGQPN